MTGRERFDTNLAVIDLAIARVCRDAGLRGADAEDFASNVKLALLSNDYAIVAKFEGRSSFATYITIVIRRLLIAERRATEGRWRPSAEQAPRPRLVPFDDELEIAANGSADERVRLFDSKRRSAEASRVVREAMGAMTTEDRVILRLRYAEGKSIADIARALGVAQRPLYRQVEALLAALRLALRRAGIREEAVADLIGAPETQLDFGLQNGKSDEAQPS
jgi:RNA polymerase sigma factor (sigma-70 family)